MENQETGDRRQETGEKKQPPAAPAPSAPPATPEERLKQDVIGMIKTCFDPEIPVNIWELGLIYDVTVKPAEGDVHVRMTLTSPSCPAAQSLPAEVEAKTKTVAGVKTAKIEVVWEPTWTPEKMSEAAKLELGIM